MVLIQGDAHRRVQGFGPCSLHHKNTPGRGTVAAATATLTNLMLDTTLGYPAKDTPSWRIRVAFSQYGIKSKHPQY